MAENLGKRAQQEREKRLMIQDKEIRATIDELSFLANRIDTNFSIINDMIRKKQRSRKDGYRKLSITDYKNEILNKISNLENTIMKLNALDKQKADTLAPHYQQKIINWKIALEKTEVNHSSGIFEKTFKDVVDVIKGESEMINSITFCNDADELTQTLANFSSLIDTKISSFDLTGTAHKFSAALAKFETGLSLLKSIDPTNVMIPRFVELQQKWEKKRKLYIKFRVAILLAIIIFYAILIISVN